MKCHIVFSTARKDTTSEHEAMAGGRTTAGEIIAMGSIYAALKLKTIISGWKGWEGNIGGLAACRWNSNFCKGANNCVASSNHEITANC